MPGDSDSSGPRQNLDGAAASLRGILETDTVAAFCADWLDMQCHLLGGVKDAVVVVGDSETKKFAPAAVWPRGQAVGQNLAQIAQRALNENQSLVSRDPNGTAKSPIQVAHPISVDRQLAGVVAISLKQRDEESARADLQRLQLSSAWLEGLLARKSNGNGATVAAAASAATSGQSVGLKLTLDLVATLLQHDRLLAAATALVTDLATRFECDRVSLGFIKRKRIRLYAVSHSAQFSKKSNLSRAIEEAMDEAVDQEATVKHPQPADVTSSEFRITRSHSELARKFGTTSICSVPLEMGDDVIGVMTFEKPDDLKFNDETVALLETVANAVGPLLELKRRDERLLITRCGQSFTGGLRKLVGPGHPYLKLSALILFATVVFFCFARGEFRVSAETVIEGSIQRAAVAPFNGYIAEAPLRAGDQIDEGDVLCVLDERDLRLERHKWGSQLEQLRKQHQQAFAKHQAADVAIIGAQIDQAGAQTALIDDQLARMRIRAPFKAVIVRGDLSQSIGAPVERGDELFELALLENYRIILEVDERDIAEVSVGQKGNLVLSAFPNEKFPFDVSKITPVSSSSEGRNFFRVEARLRSDPDDPPRPRLRPGLEGIGKIAVEDRHLIWIWTRRAVDWMRLTLWKWMP
jgi:hypothetical protein